MSKENLKLVKVDDFLENDNKSKSFLNKSKSYRKYTKREFLEMKLDICHKYAQVHPYILVHMPDDVRCNVCNEVVDEVAHVHFTDRLKDGTEKQFNIERVCEKCLLQHHIVYVTPTQVSKFLILHRGRVLFKSMDTDDHICHICRQQLPCYIVKVRIFKLPLEVHLCEKHAESCVMDKKAAERIFEEKELEDELSKMEQSYGIKVDDNTIQEFNNSQKFENLTLEESVEKEFKDDVDVKSFMKEDE